MKSKMKKVNNLGMELDEWQLQNTFAHFGVGKDWATLYDIQSMDKNKGIAQELIIEAKKYYEDKGKKFGGTVALNPIMAHIYKKLKITEYK